MKLGHEKAALKRELEAGKDREPERYSLLNRFEHLAKEFQRERESRAGQIEAEAAQRERLEKKVAALEEIVATLVMFTGLEAEFQGWEEQRKKRNAAERERKT